MATRSLVQVITSPVPTASSWQGTFPSAGANIEDWVLQYLRPCPGSPSRRAHQYTVNGLTYPFIHDSHFAAVPAPDTLRRSDMLAGLLVARPGDLLFLFDADPRATPGLTSLRGLRGIYRICGAPFVGTDLKTATSGYRVHGCCPTCGHTVGGLPRWRLNDKKFEAPSCKNPACKAVLPLGAVTIPGRGAYPEMILSWRIEVEPVQVFDVPVSDERAYSDMEDPGLLWVGRHDNQSGGTGRPGKGSSIRQLAPEEAMKVARLLRTEPGALPPTRVPRVPYVGTMTPLVNEDGTPAEHPRVSKPPKRAKGMPPRLLNEFDLCVWMAKTFDDPASSFIGALGLNSDAPHLEYVSPLYPWGYTAGQTDFLFTYFDALRGRYRIVVVEAKKDKVSDALSTNADGRGAILQVSMYVPWVVQRLALDPSGQSPLLQVIPVTVGARLGGAKKYTVAAPDAYDDTYHLGGRNVHVHVERPRFLKYEAVGTYAAPKGGFRCAEVRFHDESHLLGHYINWRPAHGLDTSGAGTRLTRTTSWASARKMAGLAP